MKKRHLPALRYFRRHSIDIRKEREIVGSANRRTLVDRRQDGRDAITFAYKSRNSRMKMGNRSINRMEFTVEARIGQTATPWLRTMNKTVRAREVAVNELPVTILPYFALPFSRLPAPLIETESGRSLVCTDIIARARWTELAGGEEKCGNKNPYTESTIREYGTGNGQRWEAK